MGVWRGQQEMYCVNKQFTFLIAPGTFVVSMTGMAKIKGEAAPLFSPLMAVK
jgi:hypothetical protein